ncbi:MAG: hypothetical protein JWL84_1800, partial [Rhodospirillales bacterium]|nr:hypothetical protein [Rhodospirillales bacterium]
MDRRIAPDFSFRFSPKCISTYYKSAARAFDCGDFVIAAQSNEAADRELKACAQILSGLIDQGLSELARQERVSGRGKLCQAYALWVLDRVAEAHAVLDEIVDRETADAAAIFRGLLNREEITVFVTGAMLPVRTETTDTARQPVFRYGSITMKYVGSQLPDNAYDYRLHEPMDEFIRDLPASERPDIVFALSPQWLIPANFEQVDVPKVLWSHDEDVFLYRNVENFALYDVAICACSQAHFELSRSAGIFCASNVIFSPLATPFPEASLPERKDIDLLFTGSGLDEFHSEKPRFIYQLTELEPDYKVKLVNGHLPERQYFDLLRHTKFLPIVNRYAGAPSPRWRDALTHGACILYPEGTLYDEIAPGCFPIRESSISADVRRHLESFDKIAPSYDLKENVPEVNRRFAIHRESREKSFERLLKY